MGHERSPIFTMLVIAVTWAKGLAVVMIILNVFGLIDITVDKLALGGPAFLAVIALLTMASLSTSRSS